MLHWLGTYLLHPLHGAGYQWWSGAGSDLAYVGALLGVWRHVACEQRGCLRPGHRHPDHGRPVCRKHFHSDIKLERKP
jgi:hypothetical protein